MITIFEEFHWFKKKNPYSDVDPYGEEIWDDEKLIPKEYFFIRVVTCSDGRTRFKQFYLKFDDHNFICLGSWTGDYFNDNAIYLYKKFSKEMYDYAKNYNLEQMSDDDYENVISPYLIKQIGKSTINNLLKRSIKNYKEETNEEMRWFRRRNKHIDHMDIDPYGEEDWDDTDSKLVPKKYFVVKQHGMPHFNGIANDKQYFLNFKKDKYLYLGIYKHTVFIPSNIIYLDKIRPDDYIHYEFDTFYPITDEEYNDIIVPYLFRNLDGKTVNYYTKKKIKNYREEKE